MFKGILVNVVPLNKDDFRSGLLTFLWASVELLPLLLLLLSLPFAQI